MPFSPEKRKDYDRKRRDGEKENKGKSKNIFFPMRLSENVLAVANRIAAEGYLTGKYAWRTAPEVIRALINIGLKHLEREGDELVTEATRSLELEQAVADASRQRRNLNTLSDNAQTEIKALIDIGEKDYAARLYAGTMESIEKMPKTVYTVLLHTQMKTTFADLHVLYENDLIPASNPFDTKWKGTRGSAKKKKVGKKR